MHEHEPFRFCGECLGGEKLNSKPGYNNDMKLNQLKVSAFINAIMR